MIRGLFKRVGNTLVPSSETGEEILRSIPEGTETMMIKSNPRNPRGLNFYWSMLQEAAENSVQFPSKSKLHEYVCMKLGHYETYVSIGGKDFLKVKSIALDEMDAEDFKEFLDGAKKIVAEDVLKVDVEELIREVRQ